MVTKPNLEYLYDAMGNRITKIVKPAGSTSLDWVYTHYVRDAQGNVMATYKKENINHSTSYQLTERHIYGSSRVGIDNKAIELIGYTAPSDNLYRHQIGLKNYKLTNHLGNVNAVITDRKIPRSTNGLNIDYYMPDIVSATDYYPFGAPMPGRGFSAREYRFGFNGQEKDNEISGTEGGHLAFEYRIHDARLGRFLSIDPLSAEYPWNSCYAFAENRVIDGIDLEGKEWASTKNTQNPVPTFDNKNKEIFTPNSSSGTQAASTPSSTPSSSTIPFDKWPLKQDKNETGRCTNQACTYDIGNLDYSENVSGLRKNDVYNYPQLINSSLSHIDVAILHGEILDELKTDQNFLNYQTSFIDKIRSDKRFQNNMAFSIEDDRPILFGAPSQLICGFQQQTWIVRHANIRTEIYVAPNGIATFNYKIDDFLDLTPNGSSKNYDRVTTVLGIPYHDWLGGNRNMQVRAEWSTIIPLRN